MCHGEKKIMTNILKGLEQSWESQYLQDFDLTNKTEWPVRKLHIARKYMFYLLYYTESMD